MQDPSAVRPTAIERVPVRSLSALFGGLCAFGVADQAEANPGAQGPAGPPSADKNADGPKAKAAAAPASQPAAAPQPAAPQPAPQPQAAPQPAPPQPATPPPQPAPPQPQPSPAPEPPAPAAEAQPDAGPKASRRSTTKRKRRAAAQADAGAPANPATSTAPAATSQQVKRAQRRLRRALPKRYARSYRRAAKKYDLGPKGWSYLAAMGYMSSDHGRTSLPGVKRGFSTDGCCTGPMQFMPDTWEQFGVDANGDGRKSPYQRKDAIYGAAKFLSSLRGDGRKWRKTLYDANPSSEYVSDALDEAAGLRRKARKLREARQALPVEPGAPVPPEATAPPDATAPPAEPAPHGQPNQGEKPTGNGENRPSPGRDRPVAPKPVPGYRPSQQARADIPPKFLGLYRDAAADFDLGPRGWAMLAGIGSIETDHGRLDAQGVDSGENDWGAGGPMQFLSETWDAYAVDGDDDGDKDRYDAADAIHSAANYLDDSGAPNDWDSAIYAYNHADWYVADVKQRAAKYRGTRTKPEPRPQPRPEEGPGRQEAEEQRDNYNAKDVVNDPNIDLTESATSDFAEGRIDKRVIDDLGQLSDDHDLAISVAKTGHDKYTTSGSVSNHWYGRAVDIYSVDGKDCTGSDSEPCANLAEELVDLGPTEIGYAYDVDGSGSDAFGDPEGHSDHVHLGYD